MLGLDQTATVYTEGAGGNHTTVARSGLRCRLAHVNRQPAATSAERAELAALRNMLWEPGYVLPETAQVEVDGVRWNPIPGTFGALRGPSSAVVYRRCDLIRVT
jgi:hypothetical protein